MSSATSAAEGEASPRLAPMTETERQRAGAALVAAFGALCAFDAPAGPATETWQRARHAAAAAAAAELAETDAETLRRMLALRIAGDAVERFAAAARRRAAPVPCH